MFIFIWMCFCLLCKSFFRCVFSTYVNIYFMFVSCPFIYALCMHSVNNLHLRNQTKKSKINTSFSRSAFRKTTRHCCHGNIFKKPVSELDTAIFGNSKWRYTWLRCIVQGEWVDKICKNFQCYKYDKCRVVWIDAIHWL